MPRFGFGDHDAAGDFEALPQATYEAVIYEYEIDTVRELNDGEEAGKNGAPKFPGAEMVKWTFKITEEEYENRRAWTNTVLDGGGIGMLKSIVLASGAFDEEEVNDPEFDLDYDDLLGCAVKVKLGVRVNPKTKEKTNSVRAVLPDTADTDDDSGELPG